MEVKTFKPEHTDHPGKLLEVRLTEMSMGPKELAMRLGKAEKTIFAILNGNSPITREMAFLLESVVQTPANFWIKAQNSYDDYTMFTQRQKELKESETWTQEFPVAAMARLGWIPKSTTWLDKTQALFHFFGVTSKQSWENIYINQELKAQFRISLKHDIKHYAISAWLRKGEIQAKEMTVQTYSESVFKEKLVEIKQLAIAGNVLFWNRLKELCAEAGVKLIYTPMLEKAPISATARWLDDVPVIQITDRGKRYDTFWFNFFHEAAHILLHGKRDVFLKDVEYNEKDMEKENEANEFAVKWLFSREDEEKFIQQGDFSPMAILRGAREFGTHQTFIEERLVNVDIIKNYETKFRMHLEIID